MPNSSQAEWSLAAGWSALGSRELDELLASAQVANLDLRSAAERLLQAEIRADLAGVALLPTADLSLSTALDGTWGQSATSRRSGLSLSASYEVDLWGRLRAQRDAALAALRVSQFDQRIVQLGVEAGVVTQYVQMLALYERLQTAQLNLDNARQVMSLVEARVRHGQAAPLELAQQRATLARQEAALPPLRQQLATAQTQLALLLGEPVPAIQIRARSLDTLQIPLMTADIPAERLWQRPDIAQAEARLHGARADVRAARAALLPSLRLSAGSRTAGDSPGAWLDGNPLYNLGAGLTQPLFDAGRLQGQHAISDAQARLEWLSYQRVVLTALIEVDLALRNLGALAEQARWQAQELAAARQSFALARLRYQAGAADLLTMLDAQRSLFQAEDQYRQLRQAQIQAQIDLFRALGGDWSAVAPLKPQAGP